MDKVSFYNLDYIIEVNEKRLEQYFNAYQKNLDKFTNILIVYSAITIFLIPIIQTLFLSDQTRLGLHYVSFFLFLIPFIYSLVFTIRLLIPVEVAYLREPKLYYEKLRLEYEAEGKNQQEADKYLKASYINELEKAVATNNLVFKRKGLFYFRALSAALIAAVPYVLCLAFHFSIKNENIQKVEIVRPINSKFEKTLGMSNDSTNNNSNSNATSNSENTSTSTTTTTTQLPGVKPQEVKPVEPQMIKENFHSQTNKKDSGTKKND